MIFQFESIWSQSIYLYLTDHLLFFSNLEKNELIDKENQILYNRMKQIEQNYAKLSPELLTGEYRTGHVSSETITRSNLLRKIERENEVELIITKGDLKLIIGLLKSYNIYNDIYFLFVLWFFKILLKRVSSAHSSYDIKKWDAHRSKDIYMQHNISSNASMPSKFIIILFPNS